MGFRGERKHQLNNAFRETGASRNAVYCGDMNLLAGEKVDLPAGWVDAWKKLRPGEPGFTFDKRKNRFVKDNVRWRFDRFFVHLKDFRLRKIEMITEPVCSDHFGLLLDLDELKPGPGAALASRTGGNTHVHRQERVIVRQRSSEKSQIKQKYKVFVRMVHGSLYHALSLVLRDG